MRISDWISDVCSSDLANIVQGFCKTADVAVETFGSPMIWNHDVHGPDARHKALRVLDQRQDFFLVRNGEVCPPPHRIGASFLQPLGKCVRPNQRSPIFRIYAKLCQPETMNQRRFAVSEIGRAHAELQSLM